MRTISGLPRGFSTCCLRFTNGVATIHAKLASGWLAGLYREGVEPSGSRRKVSDFVLILLSWTFPDATTIGSIRSKLGCAIGVRGFIQAMIEGELDETLMRPRYGRRCNGIF